VPASTAVFLDTLQFGSNQWTVERQRYRIQLTRYKSTAWCCLVLVKARFLIPV